MLNIYYFIRFTCEASNEAGKASADFVVEVLVAPTISPMPDTYQLRIEEGQNARMECRANGNPQPTIRWLKAGRPLAELALTSSATSSLILSPKGDALMVLKATRTDAGKYTCRVENSVGEAGPFTLWKFGN
jgi:hemicentin